MYIRTTTGTLRSTSKVYITVAPTRSTVNVNYDHIQNITSSKMLINNLKLIFDCYGYKSIILHMRATLKSYRLTQSRTTLLPVYNFRRQANVNTTVYRMTICFVFNCNHQGLKRTCKMFRFPTNTTLARRSEKLCR